MYTIAFFTRRVGGMSAGEFFEHYRTTHYDLAVRLPGLNSYQQSRLVHDDVTWPLSQEVGGYDALSLYTFESHDAAVAAFASEEGIAVNADTPVFMDWDRIISAPCDVLQRFDAEG